MIDSVIEKPIGKIRYPNVAKKTRRLIMLATVEFVALILVVVIVNKLMPSDARPHAILASVLSLLQIINIVVLCRAARKDVRCCHCNSPIPLDSLKWHLIASGLLPVCNKCRAIVGAEFINPLPANPANHVNPVNETPTERSSP